MRARRERRARRAADDDLAVAAAHEVRDVRVPLADRLDVELAGAEAVLVEERPQGLDDEQRRALVALGLGAAFDDVVRGGGDRHARRTLVERARRWPPPAGSSAALGGARAGRRRARGLLARLLACLLLEAALAERVLAVHLRHRRALLLVRSHGTAFRCRRSARLAAVGRRRPGG